MRSIVLAALIACGGGDAPDRPAPRELDAVAFRQMLDGRAADIESVRIEPDRDAARYIVRLKTSGTPLVVRAEFPGTLINTIIGAHVPYETPAVREPSERDRVLDATTFRVMLGDQAEIDKIQAVFITPSRVHTATYVIKGKHFEQTFVHAEFPGTLVDMFAAAGIPYATTIPSDGTLKAIDAVAFRRILIDPTEASQLERIRVEPTGRGDARYILSYRDRPSPAEVDAEYPGMFVELIANARIPYTVERAE
jgi:hypothetical protein